MPGATEAFLSFAKSYSLPTAIVCYNDMSAVGVMQAAKSLGLSIPSDLAITGFDDIQLAELVTPGLTTICQPKTQLGMRSMSLMLQILKGENPERSLVLAGKLITRASTC